MTGPRDPRIPTFLHKLLQQHPEITLAHARAAAQTEGLEIGSYHYYKALRDLGIGRKRGRPKKTVPATNGRPALANPERSSKPASVSMEDSMEGLQHALEQARLVHKECAQYRETLEGLLLLIRKVLD